MGAGCSDIDTSSFITCLRAFNEELRLRTDGVVRNLEKSNYWGGGWGWKAERIPLIKLAGLVIVPAVQSFTLNSEAY